MFPFHQKAVEILGQATPELRGVSVELIDVDKVPGLRAEATEIHGSFLAFCGNGLMNGMVTQNRLPSRYRTKGGCLIVLDMTMFQSLYGASTKLEQFQQGLGLSVHEAAHWIHQEALRQASRDEAHQLRRIQEFQQRPEQHAWAIESDHSHQWLRAMLHLWDRVSSVQAIGLECLHMRADYGFSHELWMYAAALRPEVKGSQSSYRPDNQRIWEVLLSDPPEAFNELARADLQRAGRWCPNAVAVG